MEYRTDEQFNTIVENTINGNWTDAAKNCVEFGFYANDLINKHNELEDFETFEDATDIAILAEMASELRNK